MGMQIYYTDTHICMCMCMQTHTKECKGATSVEWAKRAGSRMDTYSKPCAHSVTLSSLCYNIICYYKVLYGMIICSLPIFLCSPTIKAHYIMAIWVVKEKKAPPQSLSSYFEHVGKCLRASSVVTWYLTFYLGVHVYVRFMEKEEVAKQLNISANQYVWL